MKDIDLPFWNTSARVPLVPVTDPELNPFEERHGIKISVLLGYALPFENIKFLTVLGLLTGAYYKGHLKGVRRFVEATSGNTGLPLVKLARYVGIPEVELIVSGDLPVGKRKPLEIAGAYFGAQLPDPDDPEPDPTRKKLLSPVASARLKGKEPGYLNLDQYANPDNAMYHREYLAHQVFMQAPDITGLVAGVGTGGTLIGLTDGINTPLMADDLELCVAAVVCAPDEEVPGVRSLEKLKEIQQPWRDCADFIFEVTARPSYLAALCFQWRTSLTPGVSGGFNYVGAMKLLRELEVKGELDKVRDPRTGKGHVVVVFPDTARAYGDRFDTFVNTEYWTRQKPLPSPYELAV